MACKIALAAVAALPFVAAPTFAQEGGAALSHVSCRGEPNEIRVIIGNVKASAGLITAELYRNDQDGFLNKRGRELRVRYAARAPTTQFCVRAPSAGAYAIVAYHDQNANQKFDRNSIGIPTEPYGISNNPAVRFAPPPISKALFTIASDGAAVEISLKD